MAKKPVLPVSIEETDATFYRSPTFGKGRLSDTHTKEHSLTSQSYLVLVLSSHSWAFFRQMYANMIMLDIRFFISVSRHSVRRPVVRWMHPKIAFEWVDLGIHD